MRHPKPPSRSPYNFGNRVVEDFIDGAVNNEFGRPINVEFSGFTPVHSVKQAHLMGVRSALKKYALDAHAIQELAGLGLISGHSIHELVGDPETDSPMTKKLLAGADLAGLGMLSQPYISKLLK